MLAGQRGFSLLETVLALALGSMIMTAVTALYPGFVRLYLQSYRQYRLEWVIRQAAFKMSKDLQRAGFITQGAVQTPISFRRRTSSPTVCLIVRYDMNRNGVIEQSGERSELFGYRLRQGALEQSRGANSCSGSGWEKLIDPKEVIITEFDLVTQEYRPGKHYFTLSLDGEWRNHPSIRYRLRDFVAAENL